MKILSFGSLNFDHVYNTDHFVLPGETMSALRYNRGFGGKGLNQSIAMARAGLEVYHAGRVGADGQPFIDYLEKYGVRTDYLMKDENTVTGHAIIEVSGGNNRIILFGGANRQIDEQQIDAVLSRFSAGDMLVIQNEISSAVYLIRRAKEMGMSIFFNAAPMAEDVFGYPLELIDYICVNEIEGRALAKLDSTDPELIGKTLSEAYPDSAVILTLGEEGSRYYKNGEYISVAAVKADAVDTTAAGDTYIGYFLAGISRNMEIEAAMRLASAAAGMSVQKHGAADSIPFFEEVNV